MIPAFSEPHGAVAQLGARVNGIHEVTGSIPVSSTISSRPRRSAARESLLSRSGSHRSSAATEHAR